MVDVSTVNMEPQTRNSHNEPVTKLQVSLNSASDGGDVVRLSLRNVEGEVGHMRQRFSDFCTHFGGIPSDILQSMSGMTQMLGVIKQNTDKQFEELGKCRVFLQLLRNDIDLKKYDTERYQENLLVLEADRKALEETARKLKQTVDKIQQQLCKERAGLDCSYVDGWQSPALLDSVSKQMFLSMSTFASLYATYRRTDGTIPARSLVQSSIPNSIDAHTTRDHHWILMLKSFICDCLFMNFESEKFIPFTTTQSTILFLDHEERVRRCFNYFEGSRRVSQETTVCHAGNDIFDSLFLHYLETTLSVMFTECREILWLAHLPHMNISCSSSYTAELKLVESFFRAAKNVWDFHKLCLSFEPRATIFRVAVGEPFNDVYMESAVTLEDDNRFVPKVGFMIYPGFRLRKTVIKCLVYFKISL